jgi:hypothetical protein
MRHNHSFSTSLALSILEQSADRKFVMTHWEKYRLS